MFGLNSIVGAVAGGVAVLALAILWNTFIENPQVRSDERVLVQAENEKHTQEAINEIASNADKARAMRAYCRSLGKLYNFAEVECVN